MELVTLALGLRTGNLELTFGPTRIDPTNILVPPKIGLSLIGLRASGKISVHINVGRSRTGRSPICLSLSRPTTFGPHIFLPDESGVQCRSWPTLAKPTLATDFGQLFDQLTNFGLDRLWPILLFWCFAQIF